MPFAPSFLPWLACFHMQERKRFDVQARKRGTGHGRIHATRQRTWSGVALGGGLRGHALLAACGGVHEKGGGNVDGVAVAAAAAGVLRVLLELRIARSQNEQEEK